MNTPAHILINLGLLGNRIKPKVASAIMIGAFIPDLPAFIFYFYEKVILGTAETIIWSEKYFQTNWNYVFGIMHSIPLSIAAALFCYLSRKTWAYYFFLSILLHCIIDLAVHNADAHRHFLPFTDYKFISPISYWDTRHYGQYVLAFEIIAALFFAVRYLIDLEEPKIRYILYFILAIYSANILMGYVYW